MSCGKIGAGQRRYTCRCYYTDSTKASIGHFRGFVVYGGGTAIPVDCYGILRVAPPREDFPMARNSTRSTRLQARLSPETLAVVKRAAEIEGRSMSDFVIAAALQAAQRTIAETQVLRLSLADQRALAEALAAPPKPALALRRARTAHRRLIAKTR
jgi:uncharacterized protein (DUF1778 family)